MHQFSLATLLLLACTASAPDLALRSAGGDASAPAEAPAPAIPSAGSDDPEPPKRTPGPLVVTPREAGDGILPNRPRALIDPEVGSMMDSIELFGWTGDSQRFEHCHPSGGRCGFDCESHRVDGSKSTFDDVGDGEDMDARKHRAIRARMKPLVTDAETWAWGGLVEIVWRDRPGDDGRPGIVDVGVRLRESEATAFPVRLQLDEFAYGNLELVVPSPDGEYLALVAHGFAGESSDTFATRIVPVDELAAEAYGAAGLAALRANELAVADEHFVAATALSTAWKGPYNLACTRARANDPSAEPALREAIRRGGDKVLAKARTDEDLATVRATPWFDELVGS